MEADRSSESAPTSPKNMALQSDSWLSRSDELVFYNEQISRFEKKWFNQTIHRSMVALTFFDANKKINTGSGVLISRDAILTAAQNIFNRDLNAENTDFKIYVGVHGSAEEYNQVEGWRYHEEFKTCKTSEMLTHNYAIMKLKKPVRMSKYLKLSLACEQCLLCYNKQQELQVFGYPCTYPPDALGNVCPFEDNFKPLDQSGKIMKLYQYGLTLKGRIVVFEEEQSKIGYQISTLPGQSGCPVVINSMEDKIIAVHVGGDKGKYNVGRIVDASFMDSLWKWREELNAALFNFEDQYFCFHLNQTLQDMGYQHHLVCKGLKNVNLQQYRNVLELNLISNNLRQIDLANCPRLIKLYLSHNQFQRVNLAKLKHLTLLFLQDNQLQELDVRENVNLTHLKLVYNQLREIDLMPNINLIQLDINENKLQKIDVRANINLTNLQLSSNKLQAIDVRANVNLIYLYLSSNQLQEIDVSANVNLQQLNIQGNQLQEIDVRTNFNLIFLQLSNNRITEIDLTKNPKLGGLSIKENRLARVLFWISQNVLFLTDNFDASNQQSTVCQIQVHCEGQEKNSQQGQSKLSING